MVEVWWVALALGSTALGGAMGTGALMLTLNYIFSRRERDLAVEINELRARVDELQNLVMRLSDARQAGAVTITAQTGAQVDVGGDVAGRDKNSPR